MSEPTNMGLRPSTPITDDEKAELDFLRYEAAYLHARLDGIEDELREVRSERDRMAKDFSWTLNRIAKSPAGPILSRRAGFRRLFETWGHAAD